MKKLSINSNKRSLSLESSDDWQQLKDERNWDLLNLDGMHKQLIKRILDLESSQNKVSVILKHYDNAGEIAETEEVEVDASLASEIIDNAATAAIAIHQCSQELRELNDLETTVLAALAGPLCESDIVAFKPMENIEMPDSYDSYYVNESMIVGDDKSSPQSNRIDLKKD